MSLAVSEGSSNSTDDIIEVCTDLTGFQPVREFIDQAVHIFRHKLHSTASRRVAVCCLDHAFAIIKDFNLPLTDREQNTLIQLQQIRIELLTSLESSEPHDDK
jgi:hypothetical protein